MSDLISRQQAIDGADEIIKRDTSGNNAVVEAMKAWKLYIGNLPSAEPVRRGKWIKHEYAEESEGLLIPNYECSECHMWERKESDYCPNCGAKMEKGER